MYSGLGNNSFQKLKSLWVTLIHAQTPVFPQTNRTGLVLTIAMADQWEMLTLAVDILATVLQREEFISFHGDPCLKNGNRHPELKQ